MKNAALMLPPLCAVALFSACAPDAALSDVRTGDLGFVADAGTLADTASTARDEASEAYVETSSAPEVLMDTTTAPDDMTADSAPPLDTDALDSQTTSGDAEPHGHTAWGSITGACGAISQALLLADPVVLTTTYVFDDGTTFDAEALAAGPKARYEGENAGGSSICTEVMSMQLLIDCEGGTVLKTETEIVYTQEGSKTDYTMSLAGLTVGVSVTRAYLGPFVDTYTLEDATTLLTKKLSGVNESTAHVSPDDKWSKQILHIWTLEADWAQTVKTAWDSMDSTLKADTVVLITIEEGSDLIVTDACD